MLVTHNEQARRAWLAAACRFEPSLRAASACGLLTAAVRRLVATEDFNGDELAITVDRAARHDEITGFEIRKLSRLLIAVELCAVGGVDDPRLAFAVLRGQRASRRVDRLQLATGTGRRSTDRPRW